MLVQIPFGQGALQTIFIEVHHCSAFMCLNLIHLIQNSVTVMGSSTIRQTKSEKSLIPDNRPNSIRQKSTEKSAELQPAESTEY
jgi:hypothetical protein